MGLFNIVEAYADVYTFDDFTAAIGFCHRFLEIDNFSLAWGIHSISYDLNVSEVGRGDSVGWFDDMMYNSGGYEKPFELGSAFVVSTFSLHSSVDLTLGLGRGRYVGYGTHSRYVNSNFYRDEGGDWGIGLIAGVEARPMDNLRIMLDGDGRDVNLGLGLRIHPVEVCVALSKLEWYIWQSDTYKPRLTASLSYMNLMEKPRPGMVAGRVLDESGKPMPAMVGFVDTSIPGVRTDSETGRYEFPRVDAGTYEIYARADGYESARRKVNVRSSRTVYHDFRMQPEREPVVPPLPASLHGKVVEAKTGRPLIVDIRVLDAPVALKSDSLGIFDIYNLPPGFYKIRFDAVGYETGIYPVQVVAGTTHTLDVPMLQPSDIIRLDGVNFEFNKATLLPESYPMLDNAAAVLMNHPDMRVEIQGHTDAIGSAEYNMQLSYMRANAVRDYLVAVHMISQARLIPMGYGESRPVATNNTEEGRAQNRRAEFFILR
ncbi:OmpA family protein [candidate division WOR-3 bacterium]|nr:OmpA family protein [candidate division WOR-3 bacterium]